MSVENVATSGAESLAPVSDAPIESTSSPRGIDDMDKEFSAIWDKHQKERSDDGKFVGTNSATADNGANPAEKQVAPPVRELPASWKSRPFEAHWSKLSVEQQDAILARETEMQAGVQKLQERVKHVEPISQVVEQYQDRLQAANLDAPQAIRNLFEAERRLATDPVNAIAWLAKSYGVDLARMHQAAPDGQRLEPSPQNDALVQRLARMEQFIAQQSHMTAKQQEEALLNEIDTFQKGVEDFDELREDMAKLLKSGSAESLADAYEKARMIVPAVREKHLAKEVEKRIAAQREEAAKAAKAGKVNVRGTGTGGNQVRSFDETIEAVASKFYSS